MKHLKSALREFLSAEQIHDNPLTLRTLSTDASFYQITPTLIADPSNIEQAKRIIELCSQENVPITFRAAGTSLSGQAQGSGLLMRVNQGWNRIRILENGERIAVEPGVIAAHANRALQSYRRKIGPDPASIESCMLGGVAANNASGMCCGTHANTYQTLSDLRIILPPRSSDPRSKALLLDTSDPQAKVHLDEFDSNVQLQLTAIRDRIRERQELQKIIRRKKSIKNTMGYSLQAFLDFDDPVDILAHLMIGSEGTLGFLGEITLNTVPDPPARSCCFVVFESLRKACTATQGLNRGLITAVELMDSQALQSVQGRPEVSPFSRGLPPQACALLIEIRSDTFSELRNEEERISSYLKQFQPILNSSFTQNPAIYQSWWEVRKGLLPSTGKNRPAGTTLIIEDIAIQPSDLADAICDVRGLLDEHGYQQAILFGHALDGNLHFVFAQSLHSNDEIIRYDRLMRAMTDLILHWNGSLKAEHGTGRNMAPFLEAEWGSEIVSIMWEIKKLLDPLQILNPGVILSKDTQAHIRHLKITPSVDPLIDACIECGFCEPVCPSKNLSFTPRQRIASQRAVILEPKLGSDAKTQKYQVDFELSCATDGLCGTRCPVGIDTGQWVKQHRQTTSKWRLRLADFLSRRIHWITHASRVILKIHPVLPALRDLSAQGGFKPMISTALIDEVARKKVLYFPSCITRTLGNTPQGTPDAVLSVLRKSGFEVIISDHPDHHCCGLPFENKGYSAAEKTTKAASLTMIEQLTQRQEMSILVDNSPCAAHLRQSGESKGFRVFDPITFIHDEILLKKESLPIQWSPIQEPIAIHPTCSDRKMGLETKMIRIAHECSQSVTFPQDVYCCGFAGDKGFILPQLSRSALSLLRGQVNPGCTTGYSSSRTCEIGLTRESGIPYQNIFTLLDRCIQPK